MQTIRPLAIDIIFIIISLYVIISCLYSNYPFRGFFLVIGILNLLISVYNIIKYFIIKNKKK